MFRHVTDYDFHRFKNEICFYFCFWNSDAGFLYRFFFNVICRLKLNSTIFHTDFFMRNFFIFNILLSCSLLNVTSSMLHLYFLFEYRNQILYYGLQWELAAWRYASEYII